MVDRPKLAAKYTPAMLDHVRATCLYVATVLNDLMDETVIVGGLVPSLLIPERDASTGFEAHVGTVDLDVGLSLAILDGQRYRDFAARLRRAGLRPDVNAAGNETVQRWWIEGAARVTIDFLIEPSTPADRPSRVRHLEADFGAIITPGLASAFHDRIYLTMRGRTILGEAAERRIGVCGPAGFVVMKALAFDGRGEGKDAYDLYFVLRHHEDGPADVAGRLRPLLAYAHAREAVAILGRDFADIDGVGPRRVAAFLFGSQDDVLQAEVVSHVAELLRSLRG